jgi:hypothetical protein
MAAVIFFPVRRLFIYLILNEIARFQTEPNARKIQKQPIEHKDYDH